ELALRRKEAEDMKRQYQEAEANRYELVARLRRAYAGERIRSVADDAARSFDEWDLMAEKVGGNSAYADALGDLDDIPPDTGSSTPSAEEVEARLQELKRRMGKG